MDDSLHNFNIKAFIEEMESLDEYGEYVRTRGMWRAVIYQAFVDLRCKSISPRKLALKLKARRFLSGRDRSLFTICGYASLDHNSIIAKARKYL